MAKTFYVTTPIYYVNDVPHIGHAYTTVAADVIARYKRLKGYNVFFLTGTDEHGQKVEKTAKQSNETPKQLADRVVQRFQNLWRLLNISNDDFIRTTEERHIEAVREIFLRIYEKGDIFKGEYEDWYCIPCETFLTEFQLEDKKCPSCGRPVEKLKEESYFFRMSKYEKPLLKFYRENPDFVKPKARMNEIMSFVKGGLKDLSISRTGFRWGIPVPIDDRHVIYVWFDALTNYLTGVGYPKDKRRFNRFWPADLHLIGKDILRFHAVYWPTFLLSAGLPLPKQICSHGWWTVEGEKMSKSKGNVVDPYKVIDKFGADPFRYFLFREVPFGLDGDFSEDTLIHRINTDLANDLGNLHSRTLTMLERYFNGIIPKPSPKVSRKEDKKLRKVAEELGDKVDKEMDNLSFHRALQEIWVLVNLANRYIEDSAPWVLAKDEKKRETLLTTLYNCAEVIRLLALYIYPFMPKTAREMWRQLGLEKEIEKTNPGKARAWGGLSPGTKIAKGEQLFPRIQVEKVDSRQETAERGKKTEDWKLKTEGQIGIEDFARVDLRVGKVLSAERIQGSEKLFKLCVDIGKEKRQVIAGIARRYTPEELIGKRVIVVANLRPAKLMGIESQGMILAAGDQEVVGLATLAEDVEPGTKVK